MAVMEARILVVDDEPDILEFVGYNLQKEGYLVEQASNGYEAFELAQQINPHLILLDIMMPQMDGVTACHKFRNDRSFEDTIIAFLTARHEEYSEIAGLTAGADDYIHKPISPRLLNSKVKTLLRRHKNFQKTENKIIQVENLILDREKYEVKLFDQLLELARKEFEILWLLVEKPGKVFSRDEIYRYVWGSDVIVGNRTIDVHISKLRNKLGDEFIKTIKGVGYKIE
ncbi:MAG: response regulator transcription factor [Saprospiraceae bacterium]|nr:response regulator transcription factor [Saprospiraceae bacterium]